MTQISIKAPDDMHCHLRDGDHLLRTVPDTAAQFQRAIVMPNLVPAVTTVTAAREYRERILAHRPEGSNFEPLMTLYLTEDMAPQTIAEAKASGFIYACKLYPAGATTHSHAGVNQLTNIAALIDKMQEVDLPLLIHGESIEPDCDIFDREARFIDRQLQPLVHNFPSLRVVLEHITSKIAVDFIEDAPDNVAATITAHHLLYNRNAIFKGGLQPHYYCLPILKRDSDQNALIGAAISGNPRFFLGTDSAPHSQSHKERRCGCAGIYTAHAAMELYAEVFDQHDALDQLENFASVNGALFYQLPVNEKHIILKKEEWTVPETLSFGDQNLIPLKAGETLHWKLQHDHDN